MEKTVTFIDGDGVQVTVDISLQKVSEVEGTLDWNLKPINEYHKLSLSGNHSGSCGQIVDHIRPATENQRALKNIWDEYHLNDLSAGTQRQVELLERLRKDDGLDKRSMTYPEIVWNLKVHNLHSDEGYTYGSKWLVKPLPENIEKTLEAIVEGLNTEKLESDCFGRGALAGLFSQDLDTLKFETLVPEVAIIKFESVLGADWKNRLALGVYLKTSFYDIENRITVSDSSYDLYTHAGNDYIVTTKEKAQDFAVKSLVDSGIWEQKVEAGETKKGEEEYYKSIAIDDLGNMLNMYDGEEGKVNFFDEEFVIYKR